MNDFFEIDFLDVETSKSGDAIPLRYQVGGCSRIHIVDGGFQDTGDTVIEHINKFYGNPNRIDAVIVSHSDGDHTGGLQKVLEKYSVSELWMLRPWLYADELIGRFARYRSVENLVTRLKEAYPNIKALEDIAQNKGIPIREPFQGASIGNFTVMAPTKTRYLDLIVESDKTPDAAAVEERSFANATGFYIEKVAHKIVSLIRTAWGKETFPEDDTSPENNMSIVQYANLCGKRILLTGDAGRAALAEAASYAPLVGLKLPGIDRIQIPHHGSRHNVSTAILNQWLGACLSVPVKDGEETITAIVSAAKKDEDHPRKTVIRAFIHRGARVFTTENGGICTGVNAPERGWGVAKAIPYPEEQEE